MLSLSVLSLSGCRSTDQGDPSDRTTPAQAQTISLYEAEVTTLVEDYLFKRTDDAESIRTRDTIRSLDRESTQLFRRIALERGNPTKSNVRLPHWPWITPTKRASRRSISLQTTGGRSPLDSLDYPSNELHVKLRGAFLRSPAADRRGTVDRHRLCARAEAVHHPWPCGTSRASVVVARRRVRFGRAAQPRNGLRAGIPGTSGPRGPCGGRGAAWRSSVIVGCRRTPACQRNRGFISDAGFRSARSGSRRCRYGTGMADRRTTEDREVRRAVQE